MYPTNQYSTYSPQAMMQEMRQKLDAEYRDRSAAIQREYQEKMQGMLSTINSQYAQSYSQFAGPQQQLTPVNSEIQNAFMRSEEYQRSFSSLFTQFLTNQFFHQFQASPFYAELKKYADTAYPVFEKNYIAAVNGQAAQAEATDVQPKAEKKNEKPEKRSAGGAEQA